MKRNKRQAVILELYEFCISNNKSSTIYKANSSMKKKTSLLNAPKQQNKLGRSLLPNCKVVNLLRMQKTWKTVQTYFWLRINNPSHQFGSTLKQKYNCSYVLELSSVFGNITIVSSPSTSVKLLPCNLIWVLIPNFNTTNIFGCHNYLEWIWIHHIDTVCNKLNNPFVMR